MLRQYPVNAAMIVLWLAACAGGPPARPQPTTADESGVALDYLTPIAVDLPLDCRGGVAPPSEVMVRAWQPIEGNGPVRFRADLPVRPRARHFYKAPPGMAVLDEGGRGLPFSREAATRRSWVVDAQEIVLTDRSPRPQLPGSLTLRDLGAQVRERSLNLGFSDIADPAAFAKARIQVADDTYEGLFLPAPASIEFDVDVPTAGELHFTPVLVPPELRDLPASDGATIAIEVVAATKVEGVWSGTIQQEGPGTPVIADLSRWQGERVRLRIRTEPGGDNRYDYVLIAKPTIAARKVEPRRVVLLFVDTLRPDHLPTYGYERPTAPFIDELARAGTVVEGTRSVAPWTLPAARAALTGVRPSDFHRVPTLAERLRGKGWNTAFFAANMFLADRYGLSRGFGEHRMHLLAAADSQVDRAIAWLDQHTDHDSMLVLHFMDPHLPYAETDEHRGVFAGPTPKGWRDRFVRATVLSNKPGTQTRQWIRDRYDNNIHFVDAELRRLSQHLTPHDLVVVFSDHGEEFWDHESFEHGHSLYDEVVRVPLIFRGPGVPKGRLSANSSLLDLTPTVLDWAQLGIPEGLAGASLLPAARGQVPSKTLNDRDLPLGHPLYGFERWGVVQGGSKFHTTRGMELLHNLIEDPAEAADALTAADRAVWHAHLSAAHGAPVQTPLRLAISTLGASEPESIDLTVNLAGGIAGHWLGEDAMGTPGLAAQLTEDGVLHVTVPQGWTGAREVYLLPAADLTAGPSLVGIKRGPGLRPSVIPVDFSLRPIADGSRLPLFNHQWPDKVSVALTWSVVPVFAPDATSSSGYDPELLGGLQEAGYLVGGQSGDASGAKP